jgi:hypothetical protein
MIIQTQNRQSEKNAAPHDYADVSYQRAIDHSDKAFFSFGATNLLFDFSNVFASRSDKSYGINLG